jgi:alkylation response protein AidB-like acyl-CoA dehydrogenase
MTTQDITKYDIHHQTFAGFQPSNTEEWIERASKVAQILAEDGAIRDIQQQSPFPEISLLKSSGLSGILGPTQYGGGGQPWDVAYKVIREVAKGDGYFNT